MAGQSPYGGVLSLDVYEGELFAGLRSAISIDSNQRVGVWRMGPNSSEWVPGDSGIRVQEWASSAVLDIVRSPANPQLMVTGPGSIYQSSNGGKSWELRYPNNRSGFAPFLRFVWHSVNQHVVWGLGVSNRMGGLIHHSVDGGVTWEIISRLPADAFSSGYYSMAFDAADPNIVYLGTSGAVMKSTNGGQDWVSGSMALLFRNSLGRSFQELVSHPRRGGVLFAAADTNVYLSEDAGETVYELPSPTNKRIYSMIYDAENDWLLVASYEGIFRLREPLNVPRERYK